MNISYDSEIVNFRAAQHPSALGHWRQDRETVEGPSPPEYRH